MRFDRVAVLDWSAARGRRGGKDSIWIGVCGVGGETTLNCATRTDAEAELHRLVAGALAAGERLLLGADFAFGFPRGLAGAVTGSASAQAMWEWLAGTVSETARHGSTYRPAAAAMNARFPGEGPFWGNGEREETPGLPRLKPALPPGLAEHRLAEIRARGIGARPKSVWQLAGAGAVGAQALTGIPVLFRLCRAFPGQISVWPFDPPDAPVVLAEVYPSLLSAEVRAEVAASGCAPDEAQVRLLARALFALSEAGGLARLFEVEADAEEGWILGAGFQADLSSALAPRRMR